MILGISLSKWMTRQQIYNNLYICILYVREEQSNLVIITSWDHSAWIYCQNKYFMVILYYSCAAARDIDKINAVSNLVRIYYVWCTILVCISRNVNSNCFYGTWHHDAQEEFNCGKQFYNAEIATREIIASHYKNISNIVITALSYLIFIWMGMQR